MRQLLLYLFILMIVAPQMAFSQGWGDGGWGEVPWGGVNASDGNERESIEPRIPFLIGIKVYFNDKPLNYTLTKIKNMNTGESETDFTNYNGEVTYNLAKFKTKYLQGDIIEIRVCLNDDRCKEDVRNHTISDSGGIMIDFRLSDKQDNVITFPIDNNGVNRPIQYNPKNDTAEVVYLNNTIIIDKTKYIDNSTNTIQYISQYFIQLINENFILVIELVVGITLISITIRWVFKLIKKKS